MWRNSRPLPTSRTKPPGAGWRRGPVTPPLAWWANWHVLLVIGSGPGGSSNLVLQIARLWLRIECRNTTQHDPATKRSFHINFPVDRRRTACAERAFSVNCVFSALPLFQIAVLYQDKRPLPLSVFVSTRKAAHVQSSPKGAASCGY